MTTLYDKVAFIGLGLIASSMIHAIRRDGLAGQISGSARSAETRAIAREDLERPQDRGPTDDRAAASTYVCAG